MRWPRLAWLVPASVLQTRAVYSSWPPGERAAQQRQWRAIGRLPMLLQLLLLPAKENRVAPLDVVSSIPQCPEQSTVCLRQRQVSARKSHEEMQQAGESS